MAILLVALAVASPPTDACFQVGEQPSNLRNKDIKVRFTYDANPIGNAPVSLWSRKRGTIAQGSTDSNGWSVFKDLPDGEYRVDLHSPSSETVKVMLTRADNSKTAMIVRFTGDYCRSVSVIADRS
jgi:hypothetical protein